MSVLEEKAQCASMEAAKRLEVERFGLPNKPTGTPERLEKPVRCGDWGRGLRAPSPCPYPQGATLQALRASSPQGEPLNLFSLHSEGGEIRKISHAEHRNGLKNRFGTASEGERSEPGGRAFELQLNKPTGTPEQLEELVRCGDWGRGLRVPSPCPYPQGDYPSVTASL